MPSQRKAISKTLFRSDTMKPSIKQCTICKKDRPYWSAKFKCCKECYYRLPDTKKTIEKKVYVIPKESAKRSKENYKDTYFDYFGYGRFDFVPSELSGLLAVDVCHIVGKGRGGKNNIENLMAKTREEHAAFGDINELIPNLLKMHYLFMETRKPIFDHTPTRDEILNWKS